MKKIIELIRFSERENPTCYYYKIDSSMIMLEQNIDGIPVYISHPTERYGQNSFFNLITSVAPLQIKDLLEKHIQLLCNGDISKEREILLMMQSNIDKVLELNFYLRIIEYFSRTLNKWKSHIREFYRIIEVKLNYLQTKEMDSRYRNLPQKEENDSDLNNIEDSLSERDNKVLRFCHEFALLAKSAGYIPKGSKTILIKALAPIFNLDLRNAKVNDRIIDKKGHYIENLKDIKNTSWALSKSISEFRSKIDEFRSK